MGAIAVRLQELLADAPTSVGVGAGAGAAPSAAALPTLSVDGRVMDPTKRLACYQLPRALYPAAQPRDAAVRVEAGGAAASTVAERVVLADLPCRRRT